MGGTNSRRRQFFVKKEFQGKFILLYALTITTLSGIVAFRFHQGAQEALSRHFYRSHLRIERSGEALSSLLLQTNVFAVIAIFLLVIILSFIVFRRLNVHFYRIEQRLDAMSSGDFTLEPQPASHFSGISQVIDLVQTLQKDYGERKRTLSLALDEIDRGCRGHVHAERLRSGNERLRKLLEELALPEG